MSVSIDRLTFEHHRFPIGIAESKPRISWKFDGDASEWRQSGYDIEVMRGPESGRVDTFSVNSDQSLLVPWPDSPLAEAEAASVRVRAHGLDGQPSTPWSEWTTVETGLLDSSWEGVLPITCSAPTDVDLPKPPLYFRKSFSVPPNTASARLYITALGIYEAELNGKRVGDHVLAPGWQSYHFRHVYDTYDVTELLASGENAIGVTVGEGWWSGRMGYAGGQQNIYGDRIGLLSLLVVTLADGTKVRIATDSTWQCSKGPTVASEIYNGETYNARLEGIIRGWSTCEFNSSSWDSTRELPPLRGKLVPPDQPPVRRISEIKPQTIFKSPSGRTLVDFGQNMVGWLRIKVDGPQGTVITLRHAEVLEDGELATRALRHAAATDVIHLSGEGPLTWEPKFTFHGFRYAEVDGWPEETPLDASLAAVVVHTDLEQTGWFECSHPLLNQFYSNVRWSMKCNFVSIPTDCPQRDERLGWTGDVHAFGPTSNFLYDTCGFWKSWHKDVWHEMAREGRMVVPHFVPIIPKDDKPVPTSVWGDVTVGNPWNIYMSFGDVELLEDHIPQAQGWIDVGIPRNEAGLWDRDTFQYADWLDPLAPPDSPGEATTDKHLVSDAYLIQMTHILSNIARCLGRDSLAEQYQAQCSQLKQEFHKAWTTNGALKDRTQTAYALAIAFDLLPSAHELSGAVTTLRQIISDNGYLVGTGFAGTPPLGTALREVGATEDFYRMLLQTRVPSWLYQVVQGATTTWERWDSLLPDGSVNPGEMTSFNHYAFGSVADWMNRVIGGLAPLEPGWKVASIAPVPGGGLTRAECRFLSPYGEVSSAWQVDGEGFHLSVRVPPNASAKVTLPERSDSVMVGSGAHEFHCPEYQLPGSTA
ncbi:bacterial alpha-L-rhamnosidase-domain-containing protein [Coniochaeta sp. 2T2.1]|nr:bacterial alpha-L-rhamnosidase-domain-containing protein [Coniochaeta sp. 2T2.1]